MALTKVSSGLISADAALVDLNIDAGTLYIDATNNRVGVRNQAPTVALEVTGDLVVSASATLGDTQVGQLTFSSLTNTTTDIPEGSKLFFTEQRVLDTAPGGSLSGTLGDVTVQYRTDGNYSGTAQQGSFYFDALNQRLKVYTGSEFIDTIPFTAGGGGGATTEANATFFNYQYTVTSETNNISGADIQEIESGAYVIGKDYEISVPGTTDFTALGAADNNIGTTFTATASGLVSAGDFVASKEYTIVSVDDGAGGATTDFTLIGAANNNIGTTFTATGVGVGTGTASQGSGTAHGILGYSTSSNTDVVVFVNGVKQRESSVDGYQATTGTTIAFTYNLPVDSVVDVQVYELLKNDAYYTKAQTYTQAEVNSQISTALSTYDDQTASDARYVNITGDTMTGNLDVTGTVTADGVTSDGNISMSGAGTANRYVILGDETNAYAGALVMQAGGGSAAYGGSIVAYGHSHATKPGDIVAGISSGSSGSFRVNTSGLDDGADVFVATAAGYVGVNRTPGVELDVQRVSNPYQLRVGSTLGNSKAMVFADIASTPSKYNFLVGSQYNHDNTFEITPSTAVGGYTFSNAAISVNQNGFVTINEDGADADFRVESDTNTHMLFVDAGNNRVGINKSDPFASLEVGGLVAAQFFTGNGGSPDAYSFGRFTTWSYPNSASSGTVWKKVATMTFPDADYSSMSLQVETIYPGSNFGQAGSAMSRWVNQVSVTRKSNVLVDNGQIRGPLNNKIQLHRNSIGEWELQAAPQADNQSLYFRITLLSSGGGSSIVIQEGIVTGSTGGTIISSDGTLNVVEYASSLTTYGGANFNEGGNDADFRVESVNIENMLFVDASTDRLGIGTGTPGYFIDAVLTNTGGLADFRLKNASTTDAASGARHIVQVANGNVGDPRLVLSVEGIQEYVIGIDNSADDVLKINNGSDPSASTNYLSIGAGAGGVVVNDGGADIDFRAGSVNSPNMFVVDAANNSVIISKAISGVSALEVSNSSNNTTNVGAISTSLDATSNNTNCWHLKSTTQTIASYYLYGDGSSTFTSDGRLKTDIVNIEDGYLEKFNNVRLVNFKWKAAPDSPAQMGVIAQEIEEIFPELVNEDEDAIGTGETYKSVSYSKLNTIALKVIQELSAKVEALEARIAELESN